MEKEDVILEYTTKVLPEDYKELSTPTGASMKKTILILSLILLLGAGLITIGFVGKIQVYLILIGCIICLFDGYFWVMTIFVSTSNRKLNSKRLPEESVYRFYANKIKIDIKTEKMNSTSELLYTDIAEVKVLEESFYILTDRNVLYLAKKEGNYEAVLELLEMKTKYIKR